ncbi:MAG TPA: hypothetical protein VIV40_07600 [Kofleriaceae bacterium]
MLTRVNCTFMLLCSIGVAACGGSSADTCTLDSDCASGFCKADGTCGPAPVDASLQVDAPSDGTTGLCNPNHDGMITFAELPFMAGRMGTFRVTVDATWDTAGVSSTNGSRAWDLSGQLAGDADRVMMLGAPTGQWWSPDYPTATYATELSIESDLRGVFHVTGAESALLSVVSPDGGTYKTELDYDPPAQILKLPLVAGATWTSTSTVTGYAQGGIVTYTEKYESRVDQVGTMKTPYGDFPVLRVATDLTRTSGLATLLTKRTFSWVAECFGPVATAASQDFATGAEFTDNAEIRRLAP